VQHAANTGPRRVTLFAYIALEGAAGAKIGKHNVDGNTVTVEGVAPELVRGGDGGGGSSGSGAFRWSASVSNRGLLGVHVAGVNVGAELHRIPDELRRGLKVARDAAGKEYYAISDKVPAGSTALIVQLTVTSPAVLKMALAPVETELATVTASHAARLAEARERFETRFAATFAVAGTKREAVIARGALSNMLGGMGYFAGSSSLLMPVRKKAAGGGAAAGSKSRVVPVRRPGFDAELFTAVPSRSFFPRGFLWDEGFHHLLISRFDRTVSLDALGSWLGLVHANGWIPREQILGPVALTRVPDEFVPQHPEHANPPTLLLAFESLFGNQSAATAELPSHERDFLRAAYPRLRAWFNWFVRGQTGGGPADAANGKGNGKGKDKGKPDLGDIPVHGFVCLSNDVLIFFLWIFGEKKKKKKILTF
jgi:mannosyl-oligosaccharide glucosidase